MLGFDVPQYTSWLMSGMEFLRNMNLSSNLQQKIDNIFKEIMIICKVTEADVECWFHKKHVSDTFWKLVKPHKLCLPLSQLVFSSIICKTAILTGF